MNRRVHRAGMAAPRGIGFALCLCLGLASAEGTAPSRPVPPAWVRADETVVPIRADISRNGAIKGFLRKGEVVAVERTTEHWVKVKANDTLSGWVPAASVAGSGPPVHLDPESVKVFLFAAMALGLGAFLYLAVSLRRKRRAESEDRARQALADARRRLQNKVQLLFSEEPRLRSHLAMDETSLRDFLHGIGYVVNLESDPERFLASCKTFKPNLILADFGFRSAVEGLVGTDALLINTPVVYLRCGQAPQPQDDRVRAYLNANVSEKDLTDALTSCLKRSPERIRYSVKPVALKGAVHAGTMLELLHFLSAVRKTGRLVLAAGPDAGEVQLRDGEVANASFKGLAGSRAVEEILNLAGGSFEFHERGIPGETAAEESLSTEKILMEWAKAKDENDHHSRA